ncbi:unnamed protein product, partial [Didymodactylos carnosus]
YQLNQHILNRSFLSPSVERQIAEMFAGEGQQLKMKQTIDHRPIQFSYLCQYLVKQKSTCLNIQHLSMRPEEKEVLIPPFTVFKIIKKYARIRKIFGKAIMPVTKAETTYISQSSTRLRSGRARNKIQRCLCLRADVIL